MRKLIKLEKLELHPFHKKIYGTEPIDEQMLKSIEKHGILDDLVITKDNLIISGRRRYLHCLALEDKGPKEVMCEIREFKDELDLHEKLIEYNRYRKKEDWQLANEGKILEEIYAKQAEKRMKAGKKQRKKRDPVPNLAQGHEGKTRVKVAKELGIGTESYRQLKKLREASESEDPNISHVAGKLLKSSIAKSKKYNLFLNFMNIYNARNDSNPAISDYAHGLFTDVINQLTKIENAHFEFTDYKKAIKAKEKALQNEYTSDDYENEDKPYLDDESAIKNPSTMINPEKVPDFLNTLKKAKPVAEKPKVSKEYQTILNMTKDERKEVASLAKILITKVDKKECTDKEAYELLKEKIRELRRIEEARKKEMIETPAEPGEKIESDFNSPEKSSRDNAKSLEEKHNKVDLLIKKSLEAAELNQSWTMENHLLLDIVLKELKAHSK